MAEILYIDFETRSACDLKKAGSYVYASHPTTEVMCLGYAFDDSEVEVWVPLQSKFEPELLRHVHNGGLVVGHNIGGFEIPVWNECLTKRFGFPPLAIHQCRDTMAQAYAMGLPGSLDGAASAMGIEKQKDLAGHRVMLQLSQPKEICGVTGKILWWNDVAKFEKLIQYCAQDVTVERALYQRLPSLSREEEQLWRLDHKINSRGIEIDVNAAKKTIKLVEYEQARLDAEMREVTLNAVATCTAAGQLTDWLRWMGVETEGVAKSAVGLLLSDPSIPSKVRRALELRQEAAKSSTAKLNAMVQSSGADNRVRGTLQYHGAATGRWAGRKLQVQNLPRPSISNNEIEEVLNLIGGLDA